MLGDQPKKRDPTFLSKETFSYAFYEQRLSRQKIFQPQLYSLETELFAAFPFPQVGFHQDLFYQARRTHPL